MKYFALLLLAATGACTPIDHEQPAGRCVDPADLAASVVEIRTEAQGTAIFTKQQELLTVKHVSNYLHMSDAWQKVKISQRMKTTDDSWFAMDALMRIKHIFSRGLPEELHLLEMREPPFWVAPTVSLRTTPLLAGERVTGIGYAAGNRTIAAGRFIAGAPRVESEDLDGFEGFKLSNETNEYPMQKGASGGGIFDCKGRVIGAIARAYLNGPRPEDDPNVFAVPVQSIAQDVLR